MTDEQLGRAWCAKNGKRPGEYPRRGRPPFRWVNDDGPVYGLPKEVFDRRSCEFSRYATEADAYADVGSALRELVADSDTLRALADEVRSLESAAEAEAFRLARVVAAAKVPWPEGTE